jgi:hypothetical protein
MTDEPRHQSALEGTRSLTDYLQGYATALIDAIAAISHARDVGARDQLSDGGLDAAHDGLNAAIFVIRQMRPPQGEALSRLPVEELPNG